MRRSHSRSVQSSGRESRTAWNESARPIGDSLLKASPPPPDVCVGSTSRMRQSRSNPNAGESRRFPPGLLLSAAVGFGVLWAGVVVLATGGVDGVPLLVLGCAGVVGTAALLPMIRRHEAELEGLSRTDPLTGLANHRGFHQALARQLER